MRFERDRWFSKRSQQQFRRRAHSESNGTRRLVSLVLLLAMVLVCMQQFSNPSRYEPGFRAIGLFPATSKQRSDSGSDSPSESPAENNRSNANAGSEKAIDGQDFDAELQTMMPRNAIIDRFSQMWSRLLESADDEVIDEIARELFCDTPGDGPLTPVVDGSAVGKWLQAFAARIDQWKDAYSDGEVNDVETIESISGLRFVDQANAWRELMINGISPASAALDIELKESLLLAIDRRLLNSVRDASPWRTSERTTLLRTFQRAIQLSRHFSVSASYDARFPRVGVTSLVKQTSELRGVPVRIYGRLATSPEQKELESAAWGSTKYDIVWLKPEDDAKQPICIYSVATPSNDWFNQDDRKSLNQDGKSKIDANDGPLLEIACMPIKRLAYASQRGIDVAPLMVAFRIRRVEENQTLSLIDDQVEAFEKFKRVRWQEPGQRMASVRLLDEVLSVDLVPVRESIQSGLVLSNTIPENITATLPQLTQVLFQMRRLRRSIDNAEGSNQSISGFKVSTLAGIADHVDRMPLTSMQKDALGTSQVFRIHIKDQSNQKMHYCFVTEVPEIWLMNAEIFQPCIVSGLVISVSDVETENEVHSVMLSDKVQWSWGELGEDVEIDQLQPPIPKTWFLLGSKGWDLGATKFALPKQITSLAPEESEGFYRLMDVGSRWRLSDTNAVRSEAIKALDTLKQNNAKPLQIVHNRVHVIRATKILVNDDDQRRWLVGNSYYELDCMADLGSDKVRLDIGDGIEPIVFEGRFPMTLVSREIPDWLRSETDPNADTWIPRHDVMIDGLFYRLWSYSTEQTSLRLSDSKKARVAATKSTTPKQIAPLVAVVAWEDLAIVKPTANRSFVREAMMAVAFSSILFWFGYRFHKSAYRDKPKAKK